MNKGLNYFKFRMSTKSVFCALFVSFCVITSPTSSYSQESVQIKSCLSLLAGSPHSNSSFVQKTKQYTREVISSKGRRLFLKNYEIDDASIRWNGLLSMQEPNFSSKGVGKYFRNILSYLPRKIGGLLAQDNRYTLSPLRGLYYTSMKKPIGFLSQRLSGTKFEPAFFFKFPVTLALSIGLYISADHAYQVELQNHVNDEISVHADQYEQLIQSDFRYRKIKAALDSGSISKDDANTEAYMISMAYTQYFQYRDSSNSEVSLENELNLLDHYLFSHLKNVIENGVSEANGYQINDESFGQLSEEQVLSLFSNTHLRYLKHQIIIEMVNNSELYSEMQRVPEFQEIIDGIARDPFTSELFNLYEDNRITKFDLIRALQEDTYWQNRFQDWKTLDIVRLQHNGSVFVDIPLSIDDIRSEIISDLIL